MTNKIGMNMLLWGTQIDSSHIPVFEALREAGFDGVEIPIANQPRAELKVMAAACDEMGLQRTTSGFVGLDTNPIDPDPAVRRAAAESLKRSIDGSAELGSEILIGGLYQAHKYFTGTTATTDEWNWSAEYLHECGEYASSVGITLGLEVLNRFEVFLINTVVDCSRMVAQVGLDNVGIHYDTHHANIEEAAPSIALSTVAGSLNHVHFSESHRGSLGTGQVDWAGNVSALKAIDYQGWIVIEAFGTDDPELAQAANVWRNAFDSKEQLYTDGIGFIREKYSGY